MAWCQSERRASRPTLDYDEHVEVIERTVEYAAGRIKVLAGTGGNSTSEAIYLTKGAEEVGADGSLQVAPYYNKPTQEGIVPAFQGHRAGDAPADRPLQRPRAVRHRDFGRDHATIGQGPAGTSSGSRKPVAAQIA
jgi:hypothetical protein